MFMQRFYDQPLAQASYLIGCAATGEAVVVDPNRDVDQYLAVAAAEGLRVTHVTETHIHADFVSGARELAHRTGARLHLSAEGGSDWQYAFAAGDGAVLLRDGDVIRVGNVRLDVMHTPGHTPEHLSFIVTDTATTDRPIAILSGDFVFVGDVGRPDLLEKAAKVEGTMLAGAHQLFRSLERFRALPDWLQVWPGHGAGSACGKSLGAIPFSTVGYERIASWAVGTTDETEFVRMVLDGQPEPPAYFAAMKRINREGPRVLGGMPRPPRVDAEAVAAALASGTVVVDARPAANHRAGRIPGTLNIPLGRSFTTWAGWLVPYDRDVILVADGDAAASAVRDLAMIGLDRVVGVAPGRVVGEWAAAEDGRALETGELVSVAETAAALAAGATTVLDVRGQAEWDAGHLPGALHIPLGTLAARVAELPAARPVIVHCQSGSRSAIAASLLAALGRRDVQEFAAGFQGWVRDHRTVERATLAGVA